MNKNNQFGFGLIQVLVAIGIFSMIALGITYAIANSLSFISHFKNYETVQESQQLIGGLLSDPNYCKKHFDAVVIPAAISSTPIQTGISFKRIDASNNLDTVSPGIAEGGTILSPTVKIDSIDLILKQNISPNKYIGYFDIKYSATAGMIKYFQRSVPIFIESEDVGGGILEIKNCSKTADGLGLASSNSHQFISRSRKFTANGVFVVPTTVQNNKVLVVVQGGSGGSGGQNGGSITYGTSYGGGGGGGGGASCFGSYMAKGGNGGNGADIPTASPPLKIMESGKPGEYKEYTVSVNPGDSFNVVVGMGASGAAPFNYGFSSPPPYNSGGNGGVPGGQRGSAGYRNYDSGCYNPNVSFGGAGGSVCTGGTLPPANTDLNCNAQPNANMTFAPSGIAGFVEVYWIVTL
ncbi:MAG TPA: hypothetical protein PLJ21_09735 [Pseudobdellovibrionaceae bacterium]|nr:hypothetical protein [Pseudobdellovibrionaceae bacterium]